MAEYKILDGVVTPLVGHFDSNNPYRFICDNELNRDIIISAEYNLKVTNINGISATVNTLSTDVKADINLWSQCKLGDDLTLFVDITRTGGYDAYQRPKFYYKIGNLDTPISLGNCVAWSNMYDGSGSESILDISLKPDSSNNYYLINGSQPNVSANSYITMLFVFDSITNKIHCCTVSNAELTGVYDDFKVFSSDAYVNFIDEYNYWIPQALQKNEDNGYLSIVSVADVTNYVNYKEHSEYDDGNGSNPGQGQNDDNVGGDGNHDNTSDTTDDSDYYDDDSDSPFEPQSHDPDWNSGTPLYTLFKMTFSQVGNLITYLCSDTWQAAVTNLGLGNVFGAIHKCITVPFDVQSSFYGFIMHILGIGTGVATSGVVQHLQTVDCGTITIDRYFGDFKDYAPYTKCYIYLPYIGVNEISLNQVQGKALSLVYGVDLLDGSCVARLSADNKQLYSFSGNCATEYPIVGKSVSSPLAAATNILGNITGNDALAATAGLLGSILTSQNSSSTFQSVGGVAGNWGNVGVLTPFVYLERPVQSRPNAYESQYGYTCNKYLQLSTLSGYTEVDDSIHLAIAATEEEKEQILEYLTSGFYINSPEP